MASLILTSFLMISLTIVSLNALGTIEAFGTPVEIPEDCDSNNYNYAFCQNPPGNYPQDLIDDYVKGLERLKAPENMPRDAPETHYEKDPSCWKEEERNCCAESKYETPYFVRSEDRMKLVIQSQFFQQTIKVTRCANPGKKCFRDLDFAGLGFSTKCKTNYGTTKVLVYNSATNETETVPATFPVSCSCVIVPPDHSNSEEDEDED